MYCPTLVEIDDGAASLVFGFRETDGRAAHGYAGGYGDAALLVVINSTVEVVDDAIVLDNIAFVGKHLVVGLAGDDEVVTSPVLPVNEVA